MPGQQLPELSQIADLLPQTVKIEGKVATPEPSSRSDGRMLAVIMAVVASALVLKRLWTCRG
jgi:hypothetical protein